MSSQNHCPRFLAARIIQQIISPQKRKVNAFSTTHRLEQSQSRNFTLLLSQGVIRNYYPLLAILNHLVKKMPKNYLHQALLLSALYEILFLKKPNFAVVNSYVNLSKKYGAPGFTNAVLRRATAQRDELLEMATKISPLPEWLDTKWQQKFPEYPMMINSLKQIPKLGITVKSHPEYWCQAFNEAGFPTQHLWRNALRLDFYQIHKLPQFTQGEWWVQDFSSYVATQLFTQPIAKMPVLDVCAAPGGKSAVFAEKKATITAIDIAPNRMKIFQENFTRLKLQAKTFIADALDFDFPQKFKFIMLDAPCSALGTFRHNPDLIFNRHAKDLTFYPQTQLALLKKCWQALQDDGELLYCVCSLEAEEGMEIITQFVQAQPDAKISPITPHEIPAQLHAGLQQDALTLLPHFFEGIDGFFIARLTKTPPEIF